MPDGLARSGPTTRAKAAEMYRAESDRISLRYEGQDVQYIAHGSRHRAEALIKIRRGEAEHSFPLMWHGVSNDDALDCAVFCAWL